MIVWILVPLLLAGIGLMAYQDAMKEKARVAFCDGVEEEVNRAGAFVLSDAEVALGSAEAALARLATESEFKCKPTLGERAASVAQRAKVQPVCSRANQSLDAIGTLVAREEFTQGLEQIQAFVVDHSRLVEEEAHCLAKVNDALRQARQRVNTGVQSFLNESAVLNAPIDPGPVEGVITAWGDEALVSRWGDWRQLLDSGRGLPVVVTYADWPGAPRPMIQAPKEAKLRTADKKQIANQLRRILDVPFILYGDRAQQRIAEKADALVLEVNAKWKPYGGGGPWNTSVATDLRLIARYGNRKLGSATLTDDVPETFEIKTRYGVAPQAMIRDSETQFWKLLEDLDRQGAFDSIKDD